MKKSSICIKPVIPITKWRNQQFRYHNCLTIIKKAHRDRSVPDNLSYSEQIDIINKTKQTRMVTHIFVVEWTSLQENMLLPSNFSVEKKMEENTTAKSAEYTTVYFRHTFRQNFSRMNTDIDFVSLSPENLYVPSKIPPIFIGRISNENCTDLNSTNLYQRIFRRWF